MNSIGGLSNKRWSNGLILGGGLVDLKTKNFCFENSFHT